MGLSSEDVPLYEIHEGRQPLVLLVVHAGAYIPPELYDAEKHPLGLRDPEDLTRHIAVDIGVREVALAIQKAMAAHAILATHSRLVVDLNRFPEDAECIPEISDGTEIPLNQGLDAAQKDARIRRYFLPFHVETAAYISRVTAQLGQKPFVIRLHSFSPVLRTAPQEPRKMHICVYNYPQFDEDRCHEIFLDVLRRQNPELVITDNYPFATRTPDVPPEPGDNRIASPTAYFHAVERGNHKTVGIEIRQDMIGDSAGQQRFAEIIARAFQASFGLEIYQH